MTSFRTFSSGFTPLTGSLVAALLAGFAGCSDSTTGSGGDGTEFSCLSASSQIDCSAKAVVSAQSGAQVNSGDTLTLEVGAVPQGGTLSQILTLRNDAQFISAAGLKINKVVLNYEFASPDETAEDQSLECWIPDANNQPVQRCRDAKDFSTVVPAGYESSTRATAQRFLIVYKRFDDKARSASLRLDLSGDAKLAGSYSVAIATKQGQPKINWSPAKLEFDFVPPKTCAKKTFQLANVGDAPLVVTGFNPKVDETFKFTLISPANVDVDGDGKPLVHTGGQPWTLQKPLEIAQSTTAQIEVEFCPQDDQPKSGSLEAVSNVPDAAELELRGNSQVPCMLLEPSGKYNFGGVVPGDCGEADIKVINCGPVDLVVDKIALGAAGLSNEFELDFSPTGLAGQPPTVGAPLTIAASKSAKFIARYCPADYTPTENDPNTPEDETLPDSALIETASNAFAAPKLTLEGAGVKQTCPIAKVSIDEGEEVVPQTILHLRGDKSTAPGGGKVKKYKWTVKQPAGSNQPLNPNSSFANPTFEANTAGEYQFCLEVWDENDAKSCTTVCKTVLVIPDQAIHVELLWDTPADLDQTDSGPAAGADMDLHFAYNLASGPDLDCDGSGDPWFNSPFDAFWFNANPNWGSATGAGEDDPSLDLDDTDGAGPENLNLAQPEGSIGDEIAYSVGVHYWNDHGYGTSFATMAIYINGALSMQLVKVEMAPRDMWYVGKINWPNTVVGGGKAPVDLCYQSGDQCSGAGKMWQATGAWCMTKCYSNPAFDQQMGAGTPAACKK
jgi:hypothetical protein